MLEAKNLTRKYGELVALDRLNLKIAPGEIFCLLGANGTGKTTMFRFTGSGTNWRSG